jgi:hypothetical protein
MPVSPRRASAWGGLLAPRAEQIKDLASDTELRWLRPARGGGDRRCVRRGSLPRASEWRRCRGTGYSSVAWPMPATSRSAGHVPGNATTSPRTTTSLPARRSSSATSGALSGRLAQLPGRPNPAVKPRGGSRTCRPPPEIRVRSFRNHAKRHNRSPRTLHTPYLNQLSTRWACVPVCWPNTMRNGRRSRLLYGTDLSKVQ